MTTTLVSVASLTDGQKDCLRLVLHHYSSKEISRKLSISNHTVDQRLRLAVRHLQANDRFDAARIFAATEEQQSVQSPYQSLIYQSPHLSLVEKLSSHQSSGGIRDSHADTQTVRLHDAPTPFLVGNIAASQSLFPSLVSFGEVTHTGFSLPVKIAWIIGISTVSLLAFGAAIAGLEVLSRL